MTTLIKKNQVESFQVDKCTIVNSYNFSTNAYDAVEIELNGKHGTVMNRRSTKTYYMVSGSGNFNVDGEDYKVEVGDIISVEPHKWVEITGDNLKLFEMSNPPFNKNDEEWR